MICRLEKKEKKAELFLPFWYHVSKIVVDVAEYFCLGIYLVELLVLDYLIFASAPLLRVFLLFSC